MRDRRRDWRAGFTLLEVLVALAIIATALLAALRVAGQGTSSVEDLRSRLLARCVAENQLALHRARGEWLPLGTRRGVERQGGLEFSWREDVATTPNPAFRRIDIAVFQAKDEAHALARLTSFVVRPR